MADAVRTIVSLNGEWDLKFDPQNVGRQRRWFVRFPNKTKKMHVPGVWEQIRPGYDGVGWYRTTFEVAPDWSDKTVRICFGAANYYTECWLNSEYVGNYESGFTPFGFDMSVAAREGANELVARIINPPMTYEIEGFRSGAPLNQGVIPTAKNGWYFNFGGIWQDVDLVVTDRIYVEDCFVQPQPRRKMAVLSLTIVNAGKARQCEITCRIAPRDNPGRAAATRGLQTTLRKGVNRIEVPMTFRYVHLWSPEDPFLYVATTRLAYDGEVRDEHSVRFGMREFTIKGCSFYLNGQKIRLKGFLQQGMYPRTLAYPETREFALKELRLVKDHGFNFVRAHLKPSNPWYLDMADEMGMLIEGEPPAGWIGKSPHTERRIRTEVEGLLKRDRNHPSVVFWCLLNEAYHFRGFPMKEVKSMVARIARLGHDLDPTRVILDTAGGEGDSYKPGTNALLPYRGRTTMIDAHGYCPIPLKDASIVDYRTRGMPAVPLFVSEYGAPMTAPDYEKVIAGYTEQERRLGLEDYVLHRDFFNSLKKEFRRAGLKRTFGTPQKFVDEANRVRADEMRLITAAMRCNPRVVGLAFCQLADASGELFGATDVWRNPRVTFGQLAAAAQTPLLVPEIYPRVQAPGASAELRATLINENERGAAYAYRLEIIKGRRKVIATFAGKLKATSEIQLAFKDKIQPNLKPGKYRLRATLTRGTKEVSDQAMGFLVVAPAKAAVPVVGVADRGGEMSAYLARLGITSEVYSGNYRNKNVPILYDMRSIPRGNESLGQLRKIAQLGGCAVLFEPDVMLLYRRLLPDLIEHQPMMRTMGWIKKHPIFAGLPSECVVGYEYADIYADKFDKVEDILAVGGEVIMGGLWAHMWTRPAVYYSGAAVYRLPLGRGNVVICNMKLLEHLATDPVAQRMMTNLIAYAATLIEPGREEKLLSRCIDPLSPEDYA
jgi:hypothetical protein